MKRAPTDRVTTAGVTTRHRQVHLGGLLRVHDRRPAEFSRAGPPAVRVDGLDEELGGGQAEIGHVHAHGQRPVVVAVEVVGHRVYLAQLEQNPVRRHTTTQAVSRERKE